MGMTLTKKNNPEAEAKPTVLGKPFCGIIMPIAALSPEYDAAHWVRVKKVLDEAIVEAGFTPRLVSDSDEIGVIHGQIVQNIYTDEIVVCDVSGKNPNVMFELGMRLAFDLPTVVVKDEITAYSFDTSPIKHLPYRKDQRYEDVLDFKAALTKAIKATHKAKKEDPNFSPFLKHFGTFTPKKLDNQELPQAEFLSKRLDQIENQIKSLRTSEKDKHLFAEGSVYQRRKYDPIMSLIRNTLLKRLEEYGLEVSNLPNSRDRLLRDLLASSTIRSVGLNDEEIVTYFNVAYNELMERIDN